MKHFLPLLLLVASLGLFAQKQITVRDALPPNNPIAGVEVYDSQSGFIGNTNAKGQIKLKENNKQLFLIAEGFLETRVNIDPSTSEVFMDKLQIELAEIEVENDESNARELVRKVIKNRKNNNPDNLNSYAYTAYSKFWVTADKDSIPYLEHPKTEEDSSHNAYRKLLEKSLLFMGERAMEHSYLKGEGKKNKIVASRISGTKTPLYEFVAAQPISLNLDDDRFSFFFRTYINPLSNRGLNTYRYRLNDSLNYRGRPTYELYFSPRDKKDKNSLKGYIFIDAEKYTPAQFYGENTKENTIAELKMQWIFYKGYFFPERHFYKMKSGSWTYPTTRDSITPNGTIIKDSINKKVPIWAYLENKFLNLRSPAEIDPKQLKGYETEIAPDSFDRWDEILKKIRPEALSEIERNTYPTIDSVGRAEGVEKQLKLLRILTSRGKYDLGKISADLTRVLGFNAYEGLRLGMGLETNHKFSPRWKLGAYGAYGFKDRVVKYGGKVSYLADPKNSTSLYANYTADVAPAGRTPLRLQNRIAQLDSYYLNNLYNDVFFTYRDASIGIRRDFWENLTVDLSGHWEQQNAEFNYAFKNDESEATYSFFSTQLAMRWAPKQKFMQTPIGKLTVKYNPPVFYFEVKQFWNLADTSATKLDLSVFHSLSNPLGSSRFALHGGFLIGDIPLMNNYEGGGNARAGVSIWERFGAAGNDAFETMLPGEFFADKQASFHFNHNIKNFKLFKKSIRPALVYRALWGDFDSPNLHKYNFKTPNGLYQETGIELHRLFFNAIGIGAYYRFGAYNTGNFDNNFFIKANLRLRFF